MTILSAIGIYLVGINIVTGLLYGADKWKARHHRWRTPESVLLLFAALGGAFGAWVGMKTARHKTQHCKFRILVPLFLAAWTALCIYLIFVFLPAFQLNF